jgi:hypothetical protein
MRTTLRLFGFLLAATALYTALPFAASAASTAAEITGEIERLTLDNQTDIYSGGVMTVGGSQVILPKNLLLDLPANRLTLQQLFDQAPAACKANHESGLAKADRCNTMGNGGYATLSGVHTGAGNIIAGDVLIEKGKETASGVVSYLDYTDGYFRLNGLPNDPATGIMVRLNDPTGRHTVQQGRGCGGGANCSPDPRFALDPDNFVNTFSTGYPFCIPSTVPRRFPGLPAVVGIPALAARSTSADAGGAGDLLCPATNRTPGVVNEPPVADSRRFAPIMMGDSVKAEGNYEAQGGVRFLSAHTTRINRALQTKNQADQPDYLFLEEVFVEAPGFQNQRARMLIIGFTTLATPATDVDFWSIHRDPAGNGAHEFPLASVQGCDNAAGAGSCSSQGLIGAGGNIFRIRYDVDFLLARDNAKGRNPGGARSDLNPCWQLLNSPRFTLSNPGLCPGGNAATGVGITLEDNFGILSPIPHEIQARTGHLLDHPALAGASIDINGAVATNGQYLFPFGINLGGLETADFLEIDINLLDTPRVFEGIPWNLDRRLSPGGCLKAGGCEATPKPLDPFPFTGLDPRLQAEFAVAGGVGGTPKGAFSDLNFTQSPLTNASNRVFSFVRGTPFNEGKFNFAGNSTLLSCAAGGCPADPGLIAISATPFLSSFPPIVSEDLAKTRAGVPVSINVLANDRALFGSLDPGSVRISSAPASGSAVVNASGSISYTPPAGASGTITFSYTVADDTGAVSLPGLVSVSIVTPPTAVNDSASVPAGSALPINLTSNDQSGSSFLNLASVIITASPSCGSLVNQFDGSIIFSAPAAIPPGGSCSFDYLVGDASTPALLSNTATVTVAITASGALPAAANDSAAAVAGATISINVLANDTATLPFTLNPASLALDPPSGGSAIANGAGAVSYTAPQLPGVYTFSYTVKDNQVPPRTSNPALVVVTVSAPAGPPASQAPTANNDSQAVAVNATVSLAVLANDSAPSGTLNPASLVLSAVTGGTATANADGTVSYTAPGIPGIYSFSYTVQDSSGLTSNAATVTLSVGGQTLAVSRAQYTVNGGAWRLDGTVTPAPPAGTSITIFNSTTVGAQALATVPVNGTGWTWSSGNQSATTPNAQRKVSVQTNQVPPGKLEGITVTFR